MTEGRGGDEGARDPHVGRVLGGVYELVGRIGEGGMGVVYEARHTTLGRPFAVKVLGGARAPDAAALERFRQEAVQASRIEHDHIVDVVHFDTGEGRDGAAAEPYLVMERLRGESLAERIARAGALPRRDALAITHQVGDALAAAHARGIVHRDLKPENVFLVDKGGERPFAKVLDFGISKMHGAADDDVRLTATGHLVGTPLYISPEQARGETDRVDARADVYALGCLLYEMLTGAPPFEGANAYQLLWKHGQEPPEPPSSRAPDAGVDDALEAALLRALDKDPDRRFPSMRAFLDALPGAEAEAAAGTPGYGPRRFLLELAAVVAVGVALVGAALAVRAVRGGDDPPEAPDPMPAARAAAAAGDGDGPASTGTEGPGAAPVPGETGEGPGGDAATGVPTAPGGREAETRPEAVPKTLPVRLVTRPEGARVWAGDRLLGRTPLEVRLPADGAPRTVRFALDGFAPRRVSVVPGRDRVVEVALRRRRAGDAPEPGAHPPIKRTL